MLFRSANCKTCASEYRKTYQKGEKYKNYCKTPERKFVVYRTTAKKKNIKFDLTLEEFSEALSEKKCFYCGDKSEFALGIDRINNSIGYNIENCVSCCWKCNQMKNKDNSKSFIEHCKKIALNNTENE